MIRNFSYVAAKSVPEAVKALSTKGAWVHAGGTDLMGCLRDEIFPADRLVSISRIHALKGISATAAGGVRIGALTTVSETAANPTLNQKFKALAQAAADVASPQLRNQGTIGGNICQRPRCWYYRGEFKCARKGGDLCYAVDGENQYHAVFGGGPCFFVHPSDTAVALMALQAQLVIAGPAGTRQVKMDDFFVGPDNSLEKENVLAAGEIITHIVLPPSGAAGRSSYRKIRGRGAWDFALVSLAVALQAENGLVSRARLVLGGVGPYPWRVPAAEKLLVGKKLDGAQVQAAGAAAIEGATPLRDNAYKLDMIRGVVEESLAALV